MRKGRHVEQDSGLQSHWAAGQRCGCTSEAQIQQHRKHKTETEATELCDVPAGWQVGIGVWNMRSTGRGSGDWWWDWH